MDIVKKKLRQVLSFNKPIQALIEGVVLVYLLQKTKNNIEDNKNRHIRVRILRRGIEKLKKAMSDVHYKQGILIVGEEAYASFEGIFLNVRGTNRYLKVTGDAFGNEGKPILDFLRSKGVEVGTMIDLGANFGEISLYMSKQYPRAKILAVEASPDNFRLLESNIHFQQFSTVNLSLLCEAVSDRKGFVEITKGVNPENIIAHPSIHLKESDLGKKIETVRVPSDTLESIMSRFNFTTLDFLKVDIEGSEPLLFESLRMCARKIRAILIEVGDKADHHTYLPLMRFLFAEYHVAYDAGTGSKWTSFESFEKSMLSSYAQDIWFVREEKKL